MDGTKLIRVKCTKCREEIENHPKNHFRLPFKDSFKVFNLCPKHQSEYFDIIKSVQEEKEKKVEQFLYATPA